MTFLELKQLACANGLTLRRRRGKFSIKRISEPDAKKCVKFKRLNTAIVVIKEVQEFGICVLGHKFATKGETSVQA